MNRFPLFVLAISAVSFSSAAQVHKAPSLQPLPTVGVRRIDPPAVPVIGWPHSIQTGVAIPCGRDAGPNEVIVYRDADFNGPCASLGMGFYPFPQNFLIGNDDISSIKVGSNARLRVFRDGVYAGGWTVYNPTTRSGGLGSWNDIISSVRVEPANRSEFCNDLQEGEIALFETTNLRGDCVVLPASGEYANAESMGIANDSISSLINKSTRPLVGYIDGSFGGKAWQVDPHTTMMNFPSWVSYFDNSVSSIRML
jgi:hypothetical protein